MTIFRSIDEVKKLFRNPHQCVNHFIRIHRSGVVECTACKSQNVRPSSESHYIKSSCYRCNECNNKFSIFHNTFLDKSNIDLRVWLYAFDQFLDGIKSVSPYQVQRVLLLPHSTSMKMADNLNDIIKRPNHSAFAKQLLDFGYLQER